MLFHVEGDLENDEKMFGGKNSADEFDKDASNGCLESEWIELKKREEKNESKTPTFNCTC